MSTQKLRIGIIGCGGIANQKHLPSLQKKTDLCELVAFCDIKKERAEEAAKKYGVSDAKVYTDYNELLKDSSIDVVHVCTPNVAHCPITVAAFEAGKHVMCDKPVTISVSEAEKPMAHNTESARKMMDAWKKSGKKFTIGYQNRFRNEVRALKEACTEGELGDIYMAKAHAVRRRAVPTWGVFPDKKQQGGGPLIDIGTHALDITLWMMDNYKPVSVTGSVFYKMADKYEGNLFGPWDPSTFEVEDSAFGFVKMENGATIFLEAAWALNVLDSREAATTLCGTEAGAEIRSGMSYQKNELIINRAHHGNLVEEHLSPSGDIAFFEGSANAAADLECDQWLHALIENKEPLVRPEQAFVVTQILDAIYESARTGQMVMLNR